MYHDLLRDARFWLFLVDVDRDLAETARQQACPCGGRLHRADYPRKPRGGPRDLPAASRSSPTRPSSDLSESGAALGGAAAESSDGADWDRGSMVAPIGLLLMRGIDLSDKLFNIVTSYNPNDMVWEFLPRALNS